MSYLARTADKKQISGLESYLTKMTDPSDALKSFQQALVDGQIQLQRGQIDRELFVYLDHPSDIPRFTYVHLQRRTVTALVMLVFSDRIDGIPCFQIGCAVPEPYRNQGPAKKAVNAAIAELKYGLARNRVTTFYVEAIVGIDNEASKHVAAATVSTTPAEVTDQVSGLPALHYIRKVREDAAG